MPISVALARAISAFFLFLSLKPGAFNPTRSWNLPHVIVLTASVGVELLGTEGSSPGERGVSWGMRVAIPR